MTASAWRWENVPLPEAHLAAVGAAVLARAIAPLPMPVGRTGRILGWLALGAGIGMAGWAVRSSSAADVAVDRPTGLVTSGAFAVSRNPMYLGWSLGLFGLAVATRSGWLLIGAAVATAAVRREVVVEEEALAAEFGDEYEAYRTRTPRWMP